MQGKINISKEMTFSMMSFMEVVTLHQAKDEDSGYGNQIFHNNAKFCRTSTAEVYFFRKKLWQD